MRGRRPVKQDNLYPLLRRPKGNIEVGPACFQVFGSHLVVSRSPSETILVVPTFWALKPNTWPAWIG
jgi:hypothetical protein